MGGETRGKRETPGEEKLNKTGGVGGKNFTSLVTSFIRVTTLFHFSLTARVISNCSLHNTRTLHKRLDGEIRL